MKPATSGARPRPAVPPCTCSAYRFPHRAGGGQCGDQDEDDGTCHSCQGTGEGMWADTSCGSCNGRGGTGAGWGRPWTWRHRDVDD